MLAYAKAVVICAVMVTTAVGMIVYARVTR